MNNSERNCQICLERRIRYLCPKCNIGYCSVTCYKSEKHIECSEQFYKHQVLDELTFHNKDNKEQGKILQILEEHYKSLAVDDENLDSDDDSHNSDEDIVDRLSAVNLEDHDKVWKLLKKEERKEFQSLINSGKIISLLPEWKPWWYCKSMEINDENEESSFMPVILEEIPLFHQLCKREPSPYLPVHLCDILLSYVTTCTFLRGKHHELALESSTTILHLSHVLNSQQVLTHINQVLQTVESNISKCTWIQDKILPLENLQTLLRSSNLTKLALSDLHELLDNGYRERKKLIGISKSFVKNIPSPKQFLLAAKKIIFYLSWINSFDSCKWKDMSICLLDLIPVPINLNFVK